MPAQPIAAKVVRIDATCPSEAFLGRLSHLMIRCARQMGGWGDDTVGLRENPTSRTFAEHLSCSLKLLGFVPMHSDSQQCLNVAS
jgi:hypothetical protein